MNDGVTACVIPNFLAFLVTPLTKLVILLEDCAFFKPLVIELLFNARISGRFKFRLFDKGELLKIKLISKTIIIINIILTKVIITKHGIDFQHAKIK